MQQACQSQKTNPNQLSEPAIKLWRRYSKARRNSSETAAIPYRVSVVGSFTVDPLVPHLGGNLLGRGIETPELLVAPYDQILQFCLGPVPTSNGVEPDAIIILWRLEDMFGESTRAALAGNPGSTEALLRDVDGLIAAIAALRATFSGILVVSSPPLPAWLSGNQRALDQTVPVSRLHHRISTEWIAAIEKIGDVHTLDLDGLLSTTGYEASHDLRKWYLYKQPYSEALWSAVGRRAARIICASVRPAKKCVVLDCDNTLWGGIVGEDGLSGIVLGEDFPGSAFRDFQKALKRLRDKGIFLAVASKNNPEDVFEVFDGHDAMALCREDISVFQVHWESKVNSLRAIAAQLNIGTDSLIFIDDNPKEIGEVVERMPEVTCLLVPEELSYLPSMLRDVELFDSPELTNEDRERVAMVSTEQDRRKLGETLSAESFLESLELRVRVFEIESQHLTRVTQLVNKTNQFNLTTIRRTREEVHALTASPDSAVFAMEVSDRFGDYGLVGVAIAMKDGAEQWSLDSFLMSCRVLGRGAETSFLAKLSEAIRDRGGVSLIGRYIPTRKNSLVSEFFIEHGFRPSTAEHTWAAAIAEIPEPPKYVAAELVRTP